MERKPLLIDRFNAELLAAKSASLFLQERCGGTIRALIITSEEQPLPASMRACLNPYATDIICYRSVYLLFEDIVLSQAEIWYLAKCLTPEMHEALALTDQPFGVIVKALNQRRETKAIKYLAPPFILEHQAILISGSGTAFGVVRERYLEEVLELGSGGISGA